VFILKFGKCEVCVHPVAAIIEMLVIACLVHAIPSVAVLGLHFIDYLTVSSLILIGLLGSLYMHEFAHSFAARRTNLSIKGITISIFGASTSVEGEPSTPKQAFAVSVAGPLMNIFLGAAFYMGYIVFQELDIAGTVCFCLAVFNGVFSAYNLLPVMPLDGGFIARSVFWTVSRDWWWSTRMSFNMGAGVIFFCVVTGIVNMLMHNYIIGGFSLIAGLCLWQSERLAYQQISAARFLGTLNPDHEYRESM